MCDKQKHFNFCCRLVVPGYYNSASSSALVLIIENLIGLSGVFGASGSVVAAVVAAVVMVMVAKANVVHST